MKVDVDSKALGEALKRVSSVTGSSQHAVACLSVERDGRLAVGGASSLGVGVVVRIDTQAARVGDDEDLVWVYMRDIKKVATTAKKGSVVTMTVEHVGTPDGDPGGQPHGVSFHYDGRTVNTDYPSTRTPEVFSALHQFEGLTEAVKGGGGIFGALSTEGLRRARKVASIDRDRPILKTVCFTQNGETQEYVATDSYRLSRFTTKATPFSPFDGDDQFRALIPGDAVDVMLKLTDQPDVYGMFTGVDGVGHFCLGGEFDAELFFRCVDGKYPSLKDVIDAESERIVTLHDVDGMLDQLKTALKFADKHETTVKVGAGESGGIHCTMGGIYGDVKPRVEFTVAGDFFGEAPVAFNGAYLYDFLDGAESPLEIGRSVSDSGINPVRFDMVTDEGDVERRILMLVRTS